MDMFRNRKNLVKSALLFAAILICPTTISSAFEENVIEEPLLRELPHCDDQEFPRAEYSKSLIFVSTLDGKLTALDLADQGNVKWSIDTGGSLLSSSIHKLDLTSNGKWVRMIPSLSGGLYKFDGDSIEAIPLKAEDLLRSSFKFSDDIVISGGMEAKSYGISARTGTVLYECSLQGCQNFTHSTEPIGPKEQQHNPMLDDVLILRREMQTVRAIEPREGVERWNFSIGMHQLELVKSKDCQGQSGPSEMDSLLMNLDLKAVIPQGDIYAFKKINDNPKDNQLLWKKKFDFPIVSAWCSDGKDNIEYVDFFGTADWLWNPDLGSHIKKEYEISPSLFLGVYERQPYIQESTSLQQITTSQHTSPAKVISDDTDFTRIPFRPYPGTKEALALIEDYNGEKYDMNPTALATSVLYASEYVNGNGFYFYTTSDLNRTQKAVCDTNDYEENLDVEPKLSALKKILSFLYKWKEVCILIITSAVFVNFFLNIRPHEKEYVMVPVHVDSAMEAIEGVNYSKSSSSYGTAESSNDGAYHSRFVSDYDVMQVLGKGGFGVVFSAKNKLDDCQYAIKRIILPSRKESRERVMREVKTLAHCDHQNIVRYFSSWVETPPDNWQDEHDRTLKIQGLLSTSTSIDIGTPTETTDKEIAQFSNFKRKTFNGLVSSFRDKTVDGSHIVFEDNSNITNGNSIVFEHRVDDSDSHILFAHSESGDDKVVVPISSDDGVDTRSKSKRPISLDLTNKTKDMIFSVSQTNKAYLYIQMQLCQKHSLKEWLSQKSYDDRHLQVIPIFEQIVGAVEYVHLKGLIHRDLKPGNIFFALDGQIKIGDFGLVTDMAEESNHCQISSLTQPSHHTKRVGTHLYMSPEQVAGLPYNYKVDIYSLGLILFELHVTFGTEMERISTLKNLRLNEFPTEFQLNFKNVYHLLQLMLSHNPATRPTTFGIRARPPLQHSVSNVDWHFELPPRPRRESNNNFSTAAENVLGLNP